MKQLQQIICSSFLVSHDGLLCFQSCRLALELFDNQCERLRVHAIIDHADENLQLLLIEPAVQQLRDLM